MLLPAKLTFAKSPLHMFAVGVFTVTSVILKKKKANAEAYF